MTRAVATLAWALVVAMNAATLIVFLGTDFLRTVAGGQVTLTPGMVAVTIAAVVAIAAVSVADATVGWILSAHPRGSRIGAVLLAGGFCFGAVPFGYAVGGWLVLEDPGSVVANALFLIGPAMVVPGYALALPVLAIVFPDGRLPSRRWRVMTAVIGVMLVAATIVALLRPGEIAGTIGSRNPIGVEAMPGWMSAASDALAGIGLLLVTIIGVAAVVVRYRGGTSVVRHQLRWFVAAVLLAAIPTALSPQPSIGGPGWIALGAAGLFLVPISVWIAVTRYRLYEIDRLISRTLGWALVTGVLVAVFVVGVVALQALLAGFTQGEALAVAASTLVAFALFHPVRRHVQRAVDRRFDRARYDAERTALAFGERLRHETDISTVTRDLAATAGSALAPSGLGVWLREGRG